MSRGPEGLAGEVADESAATGEIIYLTRDGRRLAAIVPVELAAEIEAAEHAADIAAQGGHGRARGGHSGRCGLGLTRHRRRRVTGIRYELRFRPAALRELRKLDSQVARRIKSATEALRTEPRPPA